jgi:hypothetical protein
MLKPLPTLLELIAASEGCEDLDDVDVRDIRVTVCDEDWDYNPPEDAVWETY